MGILSACGAPSFRSELAAEAVFAGSTSHSPLLMCPPFGGFSKLDFNQNPQLRAEGKTKSQVRHAYVETASLKVLSPETQDFSFLDNVELLASAGDAQVSLSSQVNVPGLKLQAPFPTLPLPLKGVPDLAALVAAPQMDLLVKCSGRLPPAETRLQAKVVFRLEVEP